MRTRNLAKSTERKAGAVLSYAQIALNAVASLIYTPIMIRLLGQNEYGLYGTVFSFIGLLDLLNLGFSSSYIKFYSGYKVKNEQGKINSFNSLFFLVFTVIAFLALVIGIFFSFNLSFVFDKGLTEQEYAKAKIMMILMTVSTAISFLMTVFSCFISANERFVFMKVFNLVRTVLNVILNLTVLFLGYGAVGLVVLSLALTVIVQAINIFYAVKILSFKFDFKNINPSLFKSVLAFSGLIAINMVVDKINSGLDSILLGRFCGTAAVAVYTVGASLNSHFTAFSTAISGVFVPHVHYLVNSHQQDSAEQRKVLTDFFVKVGRVQYLILALIASGVVFFGKPFIRFWAGEGYEQSYYIALILIIPSIIPLIQNVGIEIQRAENRHHYRAYIYGAMALVNLAISIVLCQIWGGIGSAIGTCIAVIVANGIIMNIVYHKKINIDVIVFWKNIVRQTLGMIIPFAAGALIMAFSKINSILDLGLWILIYCAVYFICVYFLSMNSYEKRLIKSVFYKIKGKVLNK